MSSERARARPRAHPVAGRRLPAALAMARLSARTMPRPARCAADRPRTGSLEQLRAAKHALLVTYRRDGTPVATPAWAAESEGKLYVRSERGSGKVKRLRLDARVLIAPARYNGTPLGDPVEAFARVLDGDEEPRAERALAARYGLGRAVFEATMDLLRVDMCYLEITPGAWAQAAAPTDTAGRGVA
jgi:uncharacterized protein